MTPSQQRNLTHRATAKEDGGQHQEERGSTRLPWSLGLLRQHATDLEASDDRIICFDTSGQKPEIREMAEKVPSWGLRRNSGAHRCRLPVAASNPCSSLCYDRPENTPQWLVFWIFFNNFIFRIYFISAPGSGVTSLSWDRKRTFVRTKET